MAPEKFLLAVVRVRLSGHKETGVGAVHETDILDTGMGVVLSRETHY